MNPIDEALAGVEPLEAAVAFLQKGRYAEDKRDVSDRLSKRKRMHDQAFGNERGVILLVCRRMGGGALRKNEDLTRGPSGSRTVAIFIGPISILPSPAVRKIVLFLCVPAQIFLGIRLPAVFMRRVPWAMPIAGGVGGYPTLATKTRASQGWGTQRVCRGVSTQAFAAKERVLSV